MVTRPLEGEMVVVGMIYDSNWEGMSFTRLGLSGMLCLEGLLVGEPCEGGRSFISRTTDLIAPRCMYSKPIKDSNTLWEHPYDLSTLVG